MIFQCQTFYLMLFYNRCFLNSFQKCLLKKYGNKSIPIQHVDLVFRAVFAKRNSSL